MPDLPKEAVTAAAVAIERELMSGKDYSTALDSDETLARAALDAAWPHLSEAVAQAILAHMEAHGPPARAGDDPLSQARRMRRAWRRHFRIAAQVAATALFSREELVRQAADAMARGDFIRCPSLEDENHG